MRHTDSILGGERGLEVDYHLTFNQGQLVPIITRTFFVDGDKHEVNCRIPTERLRKICDEIVRYHSTAFKNEYSVSMRLE